MRRDVRPGDVEAGGRELVRESRAHFIVVQH
jgi:hypothetical protein